jgi:3-hydroxybutyryl-CoA dehydrogenase
MEIKNVTVFGSGVLGGQIAFQAAFHKFNVILYDVKLEFLERAKDKFYELEKIYQQDLGATEEATQAAIQRLSYSTDMATAVKDADLTIEAIPENLQIKKDFYLQLGKIALPKTIFATNSSTLLPSQFAQETGRPDRFLALHFANQIWKHNIAEVMGHPNTDPVIFNTVVEFARNIGMVTLSIYKEQPGYILNSLLVPFLIAALDLWNNGVADLETIDKTWMIASDVKKGPFGRMDVVGINTVYNIVKMKADATQNENLKKLADKLKENFIAKNKIGVSTGEGFYKYPNPAFQQEDFLK